MRGFFFSKISLANVSDALLEGFVSHDEGEEDMVPHYVSAWPGEEDEGDLDVELIRVIQMVEEKAEVVEPEALESDVKLANNT